MTTAEPSTGGWINPARFDQIYGAAGVEHDFGRVWGPHRNQRIAPRLDPGGSRGMLYAYDPPWDEYRILADSVTLARARDAVDDMTGRFGHRDAVDAVADA